MNISVVIPVYNAERFVKKAVFSALEQPEVAEVVLINDGSTDGSLEILELLEKNNNRIKIYHHKNKCNKGRSASRNLGIKKATQPYIAFLDADDFYLENRFKKDVNLFQFNPNIDGVYNMIGVFFYRDYSQDEMSSLNRTGIDEQIHPNELFEMLLSCKKGYFSIDGLTVKKHLFERVGFFNEDLLVAEDTELFYKMALLGNLETGETHSPLAMRGVHEANVFNENNIYDIYRPKMYESLIKWMLINKIDQNKIDLLLNWMWYYRYKNNYRMIKEIRYFFYLFISNPKLLATILSLKYFPLVRLRKQLFPFLFK